jgi:hypothetical protein
LLVLAAVGLVVIAGVVDALRGSSPQQKSATAPTVVSLGGGASLTLESVTAQASEPVATVGTAAIQSSTPERLSPCTTPQLALAIKVEGGSAKLALRHVAGKPCHHGRSPVGLTVRDQSGHKVPLFTSGFYWQRNTAPANFSHGFAQLIDIPYTEVCDPRGTFLAVATVGPYTAHRTVSGTEIACNHG